MLSRPLADLSEEDFASLVANSVSERRDLEFKRDLPGGTDDAKKEFLADVTSLANAQGGDLIYGVEDRGGVASGVPGIELTDADATQLRLENIVRDGAEPRLVVRMRAVPLANGRSGLVLRVPASLVAPHRVRFGKSGKFYTRNSKGKYEMDVQELRQAFTESEALPLRLRQFHEEAVASANGGDLPFVMERFPTAVLSIMPLTLLRERRALSLARENTILPVRVTAGFFGFPTLEGFLFHTSMNEQSMVSSYTLTHRTGRIDAVWTIGGVMNVQGNDRLVVWSGEFEDGVGEMGVNGMTRLKEYGLEEPWVVFVTLLRMKGAFVPSEYGTATRPAWRDRARLPELVLEHVSKETLKPLYEAFWLMFGTTRPVKRRGI